MCKKRKEKKLNMQGKGNMVLDYFIINIHMQLRRKEAGHNSFNFKSLLAIHEKKKGKSSQHTHAEEVS